VLAPVRGLYAAVEPGTGETRLAVKLSADEGDAHAAERTAGVAGDDASADACRRARASCCVGSRGGVAVDYCANAGALRSSTAGNRTY